MTAYILLVIRDEERDLVSFHAGYGDYRRLAAMLIARIYPALMRTAKFKLKSEFQTDA